MLELYIKYLLEGIAVAVAAYFIPRKKVDITEIIFIALSAAATFALLDIFAPKVGSSARTGAGFGIGANVVGWPAGTGVERFESHSKDSSVSSDSKNSVPSKDSSPSVDSKTSADSASSVDSSASSDSSKSSDSTTNSISPSTPSNSTVSTPSSEEVVPTNEVQGFDTTQKYSLF